MGGYTSKRRDQRKRGQGEKLSGGGRPKGIEGNGEGGKGQTGVGHQNKENEKCKGEKKNRERVKTMKKGSFKVKKKGRCKGNSTRQKKRPKKNTFRPKIQGPFTRWGVKKIGGQGEFKKGRGLLNDKKHGKKF